MGTVKVAIQSESIILDKPARVTVYEDDQIIAEITAEIEFKQGADGGYYHCVILKEKKISGFYSCLLCGTTTPLPHVCSAFYPEIRNLKIANKEHNHE